MKLPLSIPVTCLVLGLLAGHADAGNYSRERRAAISYVWPNGLIPYTYADNWNNDRDKRDWESATRYIQDRSCVRFRPKQNGDEYWLIVTKGGCCGSHGGRLMSFKNQGQPITFSGGHTPAFYLHELGHALGFPHEQDRPDRDEFIEWDSNKQGCSGGSFAGKVDNLDNAAQETMFDYVSLMADWTECYWPRSFMPKDIPLGPGGSDSRTLSVMDFERINAVYDCRGCYGYRFKNIKHVAAYQRPIEGGYELNGDIFYICRVYHEGHLIIGKSRPDNQPKCWAAYEGGERQYTERFEVLTDPYNSGFRWQRRSGDGSIPRNAIKGGRTKDRETVYVARCLVNNGDRNTLIPGFVRESNGREARVPFGGGARVCQDFEFLVCG